jgi:NAD(P)H dehydrogenase (quinone)
MGFAYGMGRWYSRGVFVGKRAMLCVTTGGPAPMYEPSGVNGDIEHILFPIQHGMLYFTGFTVLPPFIAWSVGCVTEAQRAAYLDGWAERLRTLDDASPLDFPPLDAYDETFRLKRVR